MNDIRTAIQSLWGIAMAVMGVSFFLRIPEIMARVSEISYFHGVRTFLRFGLYLMSVLLVGGGIRKLSAIYKNKSKARSPSDKAP